MIIAILHKDPVKHLIQKFHNDIRTLLAIHEASDWLWLVVNFHCHYENVEQYRSKYHSSLAPRGHTESCKGDPAHISGWQTTYMVLVCVSHLRKEWWHMARLCLNLLSSFSGWWQDLLQFFGFATIDFSAFLFHQHHKLKFHLITRYLPKLTLYIGICSLLAHYSWCSFSIIIGTVVTTWFSNTNLLTLSNRKRKMKRIARYWIHAILISCQNPGRYLISGQGSVSLMSLFQWVSYW